MTAPELKTVSVVYDGQWWLKYETGRAISRVELDVPCSPSYPRCAQMAAERHLNKRFAHWRDGDATECPIESNPTEIQGDDEISAKIANRT